jgi:hypothetical protein
MASTSSVFKYLLIPADSDSSTDPAAARSIETKTADKAGGLEDDELVKSAKTYFFERSGAAKKAIILQQASPEQRSQLAQRWREQQSTKTTQNKQMQMTAAQLSDEQILSLLESQQASPSCDIMALTVPTKGNSFQAVSMYLSQEPQTVYNQRASQLLQACGHALPDQDDGRPSGVYGDVFVGRCHDDEQGDVWSRLDFTEADLNAKSSTWMTVALASGGGGGSGSSNVSSLTGTLSQMGYQPNTTDNEADGYKWEQTNETVELKFDVPAGTKAKQCLVSFQRSHLRVQVHGTGTQQVVLVEGSTGGTCVVDDCTFTLQDEGNPSRRELCVVLEKGEPGMAWAHAVASKKD